MFEYDNDAFSNEKCSVIKLVLVIDESNTSL